MSTPAVLYISGLNSSDTIAQGQSTGSIEAQPTTNGTTISGTISTILAQPIFKFYTTPNAGDGNLPVQSSGQEGSSNWTAVSKVATADYTFENGPIGNAQSGNVQEVLQRLAQAIFGSNEAVDLFSNTETLTQSITSAFAKMQLDVNTNTTLTSSQQLGNALLYYQPERFTMQYTAVPSTEQGGNTSLYKSCKITGAFGQESNVNVVLSLVEGNVTITSIEVQTSNTLFSVDEEVSITDPLGLTNLSITGRLTSSDVTALSTGTGVLNLDGVVLTTGDVGVYTQIEAKIGSANTDGSAICTCILNLNNSIKSIYVTSAGSEYLKTNEINFTNGAGVGNDIKIPSINSVQTAMLNGTLDAPTEQPLQINDTIRVLYTINQHSDQTIAGTSDTAIMEYTTYMDFVLT